MTAQDQQSREAYEDGKWYWVEHEGWHGEPPTIAPACYKANCDAWYSHIFSGISTPYLKVLEPCERQAARALPAGVTPVAKIHKGKLTWSIPWPEYSVDTALLTGGHDLFTAAQVLAMGRVPPGWQAVPVEPTKEMKRGAQMAAMDHSDHGEWLTYEWQDVLRTWKGLLAAAPRPPAAQQRKPLDSVRQMVDQQKAKRDALVAKGICAECEGEGVQGGQFCGGGDWTCETCSGTGQITPEAP